MKRLYLLGFAIVAVSVLASLIFFAGHEKSDSRAVIASEEVDIGTLFAEGPTFVELSITNKSSQKWHVKGTVYSCCGDAEKDYRYTPSVVAPNQELRIRARLDLPVFSENTKEHSIRDYFWIEVLAEPSNQEAIVVVNVKGKQLNCLPDMPNILYLQEGSTSHFRLHPSTQPFHLKLHAECEGVRTQIVPSRKIVTIKADNLGKYRRGKLTVVRGATNLRVVDLVIRPTQQIQFTPRTLGFGVLQAGEVGTKRLRVCGSKGAARKIRLRETRSTASEVKVRVLENDGDCAILEVYLTPKREGYQEGFLVLEIDGTVVRIPWSCEVL